MKNQSLLDRLVNSIWVEDFLIALIKSCALLIAIPVVILTILGMILEVCKQ